MAAAASPPRKVPVVPLAVGVLTVLAIVGGWVYLNRPAPSPRPSEQALPEARAYVSHLRLSDVKMQAADNFLNQRVVEVEGNIKNDGPRALQSVDIYCLFYSIDGREIHRERVPIVAGKGRPLQPSEMRPFRLPFDALPDGWNQAVPHMVIAQITFAQQR